MTTESTRSETRSAIRAVDLIADHGDALAVDGVLPEIGECKFFRARDQVLVYIRAGGAVSSRSCAETQRGSGRDCEAADNFAGSLPAEVGA
jgi:hypothetical protein